MEKVKEKLVELLKLIEVEELLDITCDKGLGCGYSCSYGINDCVYGVIADCLFQNGVTIQEWIPANEKPNRMIPVICLYKNVDGNQQISGGYVNEFWCWTFIGNAKGTITHWMPMPKPPKGGCSDE